MTASLVYQPIASGGLGMVHVESYDKALKIAWLFRAIKNPSTFYALHLQQCLPMPLSEFVSYHIKKKHLWHIFLHKPDPFWSCVLEHWCDLHYTGTKDHMGLMPIAYNSRLCTSTAHPIFTSKGIANYRKYGLYSVSDFIEQYDSLPVEVKRLLGAKTVIKNVSNEWLTAVDSGELGEVLELETFVHKPIVVHNYYVLIIKNLQPFNRALITWETDLQLQGQLGDQ